MSELSNSKQSSSRPRIHPMKKKSDLSNLVYGKVQPQAIPLEEAVLGALMIDQEALAAVLDILNADSFYTQSHQKIFKAITNLFERNFPIDLLTVKEELSKRDELESIGGPQYLVELTNKVASAANIEHHARIIAQKHIQRELIRVSTQIIQDAFEDTKDVFELLDDAESSLFEITQNNLNRSYETLENLSIRAQKQIEELAQKDDGLTGIPTGFTKLDRFTSGWQASDLIIVAARPGMGKTSLTLALARNAAADYQKPVAIFSLEMTGMQLTQRLLSYETEISSQKLRNGQLEDEEIERLNAAIGKMSEVPIYVDDTPAINIFELRAKCRRLKMKHDIQLVVVDYLQLMSGGPDNKHGNREQEISNISRSLKGMAKELEIPVIALSQLSREVEKRGGNKRPQLSDLRESGAIEQDADLVTFIYRPDYYEMVDDIEDQDKAEIIIAKHRNGATGTVNLRFIGKYAKFVDWEEDELGDFDRGDFDDGYDSVPFITRQSRMNEEDEPPF